MVRATWVGRQAGAARVCPPEMFALRVAEEERGSQERREDVEDQDECLRGGPRGRDFLRKPKKKIRDGKNLVCAVLRL